MKKILSILIFLLILVTSYGQSVTFTGTVNDNGNDLEWVVLPKTNNVKYVLEKSSDTTIWTIVKEREGAGKTELKITYKFTDQNPFIKTYYKLLVIDGNGKSTPIMLTLENHKFFEVLKLYPKFDDGLLAIELKLNRAEAFMLKILDLDGNTYATKIINGYSGINTYYYDTSKLGIGVYLIEASSNSISITKIFANIHK